MKGRILRKILGILIVILMTSQSSFAQVYQHPHSIGLSNDQFVILLVGLKQYELAESERTMLHGKKIVEVIRAGNWVDAVGKAEAKEIIVRHNSGFAGLYTPAGNLVRPVELADGSNPIQQETRTGAIRDVPYLELRDQTGYQTGGIIDPYRHQQYVDQYANNARLSPGWGYNSNYDKPRSRRSAVVDALNFMPYDTTTPLNYAAQFGSSPTLSTGYALGVVPHFIGLIARMKRGQAERDDYTYYKREQGMPNYLDAAPDYYYQGAKNEPSNPITTDPNFVRYDNAPQAFQQAFPGFGANHGPQQVPNFNPGNPYLGG
jgi:hypothetical protein